MINISKRLKAVADFIDDGSNIIDVGCDHGLLGIYLLQSKRNVRVVATDIKEGALNQARMNIKKYNMEDKIETRLGNGLDVLGDKEVDTIIISGLGYQKISEILYSNKEKLLDIKNIIIQSNTNVTEIRKKVCALGYYIKNERLVLDNKIIYAVVLFEKGHAKYTKKDLMFGPVLIKKKDKLFHSFFESDIKMNEVILKKIPRKYFLKRWKIKRRLRLLKSH